MKKESDLSVLLKEGAVHLKGRITPGNVHIVVEALAFLSIQNISAVTFYIHSGGGGFDPSMDLYDLLKRSKKTMVGVVEKKASSMAVVVLQGCAVRKAHRDALILIHDLSLGENIGTSDKDDLAKKRKIAQEKIYRIFSERTGRSMEKVAAKCKENKKMSAQEALEFGLIDEII